MIQGARARRARRPAELGTSPRLDLAFGSLEVGSLGRRGDPLAGRPCGSDLVPLEGEPRTAVGAGGESAEEFDGGFGDLERLPEGADVLGPARGGRRRREARRVDSDVVARRHVDGVVGEEGEDLGLEEMPGKRRDLAVRGPGLGRLEEDLDGESEPGSTAVGLTS